MPLNVKITERGLWCEREWQLASEEGMGTMLAHKCTRSGVGLQPSKVTVERSFNAEALNAAHVILAITLCTGFPGKHLCVLCDTRQSSSRNEVISVLTLWPPVSRLLLPGTGIFPRRSVHFSRSLERNPETHSFGNNRIKTFCPTYSNRLLHSYTTT